LSVLTLTTGSTGIKIYVCLSDYSIFIALFLHTTFFLVTTT
jgi:hypothetical protein